VRSAHTQEPLLIAPIRHLLTLTATRSAKEHQTPRQYPSRVPYTNPSPPSPRLRPTRSHSSTTPQHPQRPTPSEDRQRHPQRPPAPPEPSKGNDEDPQPTRPARNPQATRPTKTPANQANEDPQRTRPTKNRPTKEWAARGVRGVVPPGKHCEPRRSRLKGGEHRATPGGYGGKPPGVAFIGVPTGARNAGSGAPTGDQSTDMNVTRKRPLLCQDPITTRSPNTAEQANHEAD